VSPEGRDATLLLTTRSLRLLSYGYLSIILAFYLAGLGLSIAQIGTLFTVALVGGAVTTALVSATAGWLGVRRALIAWSALLAVGGVALAASRAYPALLAVAALGGLSPSGQDVGPFLSLEQAALAGAGPRVRLYAWYNLAGYVAVAVGGLVVATAIPALQRSGLSLLDAQRALVWSFAAMGVVLVTLLRPPSWRPEAQSSRNRSIAPALLCARCKSAPTRLL
jgi:MFS family permease